MPKPESNLQTRSELIPVVAPLTYCVPCMLQRATQGRQPSRQAQRTPFFNWQRGRLAERPWGSTDSRFRGYAAFGALFRTGYCSSVSNSNPWKPSVLYEVHGNIPPLMEYRLPNKFQAGGGCLLHRSGMSARQPPFGSLAALAMRGFSISSHMMVFARQTQSLSLNTRPELCGFPLAQAVLTEAPSNSAV